MRKSLSVFALTGFFLLVPCPEDGKLLLQLCGAAQVLELVPVAGEQAGVFGAGKAVIQQKHHAPVFLPVRMTRPAACSTLFMPGKR